jgi:hypothetical protein
MAVLIPTKKSILDDLSHQYGEEQVAPGSGHTNRGGFFTLERVRLHPFNSLVMSLINSRNWSVSGVGRRKWRSKQNHPAFTTSTGCRSPIPGRFCRFVP